MPKHSLVTAHPVQHAAETDRSLEGRSSRRLSQKPAEPEQEAAPTTLDSEVDNLIEKAGGYGHFYTYVYFSLNCGINACSYFYYTAGFFI